MSWLTFLKDFFGFIMELWNRFKTTTGGKVEDARKDAAKESQEAKDDPNSRPKWD